MNRHEPNSSSLGVDVTVLLVGATVLALVTPMIGALLRWRKAPRRGQMKAIAVLVALAGTAHTDSFSVAWRAPGDRAQRPA